MNIEYSSRSKFLQPCRAALSEHKKQLAQGVEVVLEPGGYDVAMSVLIEEHDRLAFTAQWKGSDVSRFPVRIKAAATALFDEGQFGNFEISHDNGRLIGIKLRKIERENARFRGGLGNFWIVSGWCFSLRHWDRHQKEPVPMSPTLQMQPRNPRFHAQFSLA